MDYVDKIINQSISLATEYAPKLALAILTLVVGLWLIKVLKKYFLSFLNKSSIDANVHPFLSSLVSILLKVVLFISIAGLVGIKTSSFIAVLGAAGLAVGLALQGSLSNLAGGVVILILRPFRIGDYIEAQGEAGSVKSIQMFHTLLNTPDNKLVVIPNGPLANGNIINYTIEGTRRMDFTFGVSYDDDIKKVKEVLEGLIQAESRFLKDPAPFVGLSEFGDSAINIVARPWCKVEDYWNIYFEFKEKVNNAFAENNISFPYPQTDVHLFQADAQSN
ncbi:MAG: mechanosensitive ion channel family protein [Thermonemataceae bacterium]